MGGRIKISLLLVCLFLGGGVYGDGGYFIQQGGPDASICIEAENYAVNDKSRERARLGINDVNARIFR